MKAGDRDQMAAEVLRLNERLFSAWLKVMQDEGASTLVMGGATVTTFIDVLRHLHTCGDRQAVFATLRSLRALLTLQDTLYEAMSEPANGNRPPRH